MGMFGNAFKPGGKGRDIAGIIGDGLLAASGGKPVYAAAKGDLLQQREMMQRQMMLAQYKAQNPDPTGTMQNVREALNNPDPKYRDLMTRTLQAPHYITLGNAENGQTVIDANAPPQPSGPPPEAVAHLKSDPSLAAQFDEVFGPGAAARAMGGQ